MYDQDAHHTWVTFTELKGRGVTREEVETELRTLPLDGVLGHISTLSLDLAKRGHSCLQADWQIPRLSHAVTDDFPAEIPGASKIWTPFGLELPTGRYKFIHNQNLAVLAHLALMNCPYDRLTPRLDVHLKRRVYRILLILNDLLAMPEALRLAEDRSLIAGRSLCCNWLRNYQFGLSGHFLIASVLDLARQDRILSILQNSGNYDIREGFRIAANGIELPEWYEILGILMMFVDSAIKPGRHWIPRRLLRASNQHHQETVDRMIQPWIRTPVQYRQTWGQAHGSSSSEGRIPGYDHVCLRQSPLIAAREHHMVCPFIPFLRDKIGDAAYYIMSDHLSNRERGRFQSGCGEAFQAYACALIDRVGLTVSSIGWESEHSIRSKKGAELADSLLFTSGMAIAIEHKGQRPGSEFLRGGDGHLVLGPSDDIVNALDNEKAVPLARGRDGDRGMLTKGMWQQSVAGPDLVKWIQRATGSIPQTILPVYVTLNEPRMDAIVRSGYIESLIKSARLYEEEYWGVPQWMHISDLEAVVYLAEEEGVYFHELLLRKVEIAPFARFDLFLENEYGRIPFDIQLLDHGKRIMKSASRLLPDTDDVE